MLSQSNTTARADIYEAEILRHAAAICEYDLASNANRPHILYFRGLLLAREAGHFDAAVACFKRAIELEPSRASYYVTLGDLLSAMNRHSEAIGAYLHALVRSGEGPSLYIRLGRALHRYGQLLAAIVLYRQALRIRPNCAHAHGGLGDVLYSQRRLGDAIERYQTALQLDPHAAHGYLRLGRARLAHGDWDLALACFRRGLQMRSDHASLHVGMGQALLKRDSLKEAIDCFRNALTSDPKDIDASRHLVLAATLLLHRDEIAHAWFHFGTALHAALRYEEASIAYSQAVALKSDLLPAVTALAHIHLACGRPRTSLAWIRRALVVAPKNNAAHVDLASALHLLGDSAPGWDEFAWVYPAQELKRRGFECPLWDGSPLSGRTILLWTDMGRGDVIHFLRYIPAVKQQGARIIVYCNHPRLVPLVERIPGVDRVVVPGAPLPHFHVHAPLNFFPAFVRTSPTHAYDGVPYLSVNPNLVTSWRRKLGSVRCRTVGLSWGGNAETRSAPGRFVPLAAFAPLGGLAGVRFVSVQHGPQTAELLAPPRGLQVERVLDESSSILDAAALVSSLDLVITVDTMIAHLAGALARPVWTLLRYATNWRWQMAGESTPWYPTMRLFRQPRLGDWDSVFERVRTRLTLGQ